MRRPLLAANWKMHAAPAGFDAADSPYRPRPDMDVIVFPMFLDIAHCIDKGLETGGQWGHPDSEGAHTGDVSMQMLADAGCTWVLCGHSERRRAHEESDAFIALQAMAALKAGLHPIVCVGETEDERTEGLQMDTVRRQLQGIPDGVTIAYEPVWAIGTGKNATPEDAQAMHAFIRSQLKNPEVRILYGGSLNAKNAQAILSLPDIDGGLIGGCSLKPEDFAAILRIAGEK